MKGFTDKALILLPSDEGLKNMSIENKELYRCINNLINILNNNFIKPYLLFTNIDEPYKLDGDYKVICNIYPDDIDLIKSVSRHSFENTVSMGKLDTKFNKSQTISRGMTDMQIAGVYNSRIKQYSKQIALEFNFIIDLQRSKGKILKIEPRDGLLLLKADTSFYPKVYLSQSEMHIANMFPEIEDPTCSLLNWKEKVYEG